jgi:cation transport ATPase
MEEEKEEEKKALFLVSIYDNAHCHFSFFLGAVFSSCGMFHRHLGYREQRTRTQGAESDQGVKKEKIKEKETKQEKKKNQNCDEEEEEETGVLRRLLLHWIFHLPIFYFLFYFLPSSSRCCWRLSTTTPISRTLFFTSVFFSFIFFILILFFVSNYYWRKM